VRLPLVPRWRIGDLHQFTGTIGLGLLCTHIAVLTALQQQAFSPAELFTPFLRQINPAAPVLGISGLYALLIVSVVSRARRHIGMRTWRMVHTLSFAAFALSLAHAITAGPDASADWVRAVYIATVSTLLALDYAYPANAIVRRLAPATSQPNVLNG